MRNEEDFTPESLERPHALIGNRVEIYERIGSTNDECMRRAHEGADEGLVIMAEVQEKGKGRLGRTWESPPGVNILFSVLLRPHVTPDRSLAITLVSAVAAAKAVERETGLRPRIKWPNDLELNGRKFCGILSEMWAKPDRLECVVMGMGMNVNMQIRDLPPEVADRATSLSEELGRLVPRASLARTIFEELEKGYEEFQEGKIELIFEDWHERAKMRGEEVRVSIDGVIYEGRVSGLDEHGALLIETDKDMHRVLAGDVEWLRRK